MSFFFFGVRLENGDGDYGLFCILQVQDDLRHLREQLEQLASSGASSDDILTIVRQAQVAVDRTEDSVRVIKYRLKFKKKKKEKEDEQDADIAKNTFCLSWQVLATEEKKLKKVHTLP